MVLRKERTCVMNVESEIGVRVEKIKQIFLAAQSFTQQQTDLNAVIIRLEKTENEFRSVAYEGASVAIAMQDFSGDAGLNKWRIFLEGAGAKYATQIYVGLGWAIAQQRISTLPVIETLHPLMQFRVLDGYGYYDGVCRQRSSIISKQIPAGFEGRFLSGYDQGIGRSLWYIYKGAIEKSLLRPA